MKIILGTQSPPKVQAIEEAIKSCIYFQDLEIEITSVKANS
jgi:non-canonical (house-cleaning) NTP pyrophosphatase